MTQGTCHLSQELSSPPQHLPLARDAQAVTSSPLALLPDLGLSQAVNLSTKYDIIVDPTDGMGATLL